MINSMILILELLSTPIMFMNMFSGIIGGVWLAIIGEWSLVGFGLILLFTHHWYFWIYIISIKLLTNINYFLTKA